MSSRDCRRQSVDSRHPVSHETPKGCWCPRHGCWHWKQASPSLVGAPWGPPCKGCGKVCGGGTPGLASDMPCCWTSLSTAFLLQLLCVPRAPRGSPELGNAAAWCEGSGRPQSRGGSGSLCCQARWQQSPPLMPSVTAALLKGIPCVTAPLAPVLRGGVTAGRRIRKQLLL